MSFLIKWVLPTALPLILDIIIDVLKDLSKKSDSNVDDALVNTLEAEKLNIVMLALTQAKKVL